jgi:hypothetical protein
MERPVELDWRTPNYYKLDLRADVWDWCGGLLTWKAQLFFDGQGCF